MATVTGSTRSIRWIPPPGGYMTTQWNQKLLLEQFELGEDSRVEFKEARFKGGRVAVRRREAVADELAALGEHARRYVDSQRVGRR